MNSTKKMFADYRPAESRSDPASRRTADPSSRPLSERRYLNEIELANRWGMSPKTLTRWRGLGKGPVFAKFSKKVAYPMDGPGGVLDFEQRQLYISTSERVKP